MIEEFGNDFVPFVAIAGGLSVVAFWIAAATLHAIFKIWSNNQLKLKLVDRGFSAGEISQIVDAGETGSYAVDTKQRHRPSRQPAAPVKTGSAY